MEDYLTRLPEGKYREYINNEYNTVRQIILSELDLKPSDVHKYLNKVYETV